MRKITLVAAVAFGLSFVGPADAQEGWAFTRGDVAHARTLIGGTTSDGRIVRCWRGPLALTCSRNARPALANRRYTDVFRWTRAEAKILLEVRREGRLILRAEVAGISAKSFLIKRVLATG